MGLLLLFFFNLKEIKFKEHELKMGLQFGLTIFEILIIMGRASSRKKSDVLKSRAV